MKILATAAATLLIASSAVAGTWETRCSIESVPYQDSVTGGTPEQVLGGAIIGGLLGKAATDDNAGAVVGALIGGAIANESATSTVTQYRDVETCANVYIPDQITNEAVLRQAILDLNAGRKVSAEMTMDVQYTIGVGYDGKWGPKSRGAAQEYLASLAQEEEAVEADGPLYSLVVNDVVIVSSLDVAAIDQIKKALAEAGVSAAIFVDMQ